MSTEFLLDRPLPNSAESEAAILGAVILDNTLFEETLELLTANDFYLRAHYHIFRAMISLRERGSKLNPILIGEELRREGVLEQVGGIAYISSLTYGLPHFRNIAAYAKVVSGKSLLRQLVKTLNRITSEALEEEDEPEIILEHAEQAIRKLAKEFPKQYQEYKKENFEELKRAQNKWRKAKGQRNKIFIRSHLINTLSRFRSRINTGSKQRRGYL